jgi:hypothetical protein
VKLGSETVVTWSSLVMQQPGMAEAYLLMPIISTGFSLLLFVGLTFTDFVTT